MIRTLALVIAVLTAACAGVAPGLMSWREYSSRPRSFPYVLQIAAAPGALFYYGGAHTNDPAHPQIAEIQRAWQAFKPTFAFNEGGAPPALETIDETVRRNGEAALVRWLARRDSVPVQTFEPSRAELVAGLAPRFTPEQFKVATILRNLSQDARRAEPDRFKDIDAEVVRLLTILSRTPGLEGAPATAGEFAAAAARLAPPGSDWRRLPAEWFDPAPDPPPSWLNAFCRAESDFRDEIIMQKLAQKVREGARVFAVIGGTHVVMQERALRSRLALKQESGQ